MYELGPKIIYLLNAGFNLFVFLVVFFKPECVVNKNKLLGLNTLGMGFAWGVWGVFNLFHASEGYPPQYMFYITGGVPLIPIGIGIYKYIDFGIIKK